MADRSAIDTITGYFYQFDKTIYEILNHKDPDQPISLECIEDIDIYSATDITAMQCKYYHKTKYDHSVIKKAIQEMVKDFAKRKKSGDFIKYFLYGHYKSDQFKLGTVNLSLLKDSFLTTNHYPKDAAGNKSSETIKTYDDLLLSDTDLLKFLTLLTIDINAPTIEVQYEKILELLEQAFPTHQILIESFYYSNALSVIRELSTEQNKLKRKITKTEFIEKINKGDRLISALLIARFSKEKYIKTIRKDFFSTLNIDPFDRFFLIEIRKGEPINRIRDLIYSIFSTWTKTSLRTPIKFCPKIYLHGILEADLIALKSLLYDEGIRFRDGYPFKNSNFTVQDFQPEPSIQTGVKIDFLNSISDLQTLLNHPGKRKEVYQFYYNKLYFNFSGHTIIPILVQDFSYIEGILK